MVRDFSNIDYLKDGSPVQKRGWEVLTNSRILMILKPFHSILTGTLPLDIFIEGKSDLDISCEVYNPEDFISVVTEHFSCHPHFTIREKKLGAVHSTIASFKLFDFPVEIVSQPLPMAEQVAIRHLYIEYALLQRHGEAFKKKIKDLKRQGLKTEPAFAALLHLGGDPYEALLNLEKNLSERNQ